MVWTLYAEEIKFRMSLLFLFFPALTFVCGTKSTESAFENEKAGTLKRNQSYWRETDESAREEEALKRLEIELEELLQNHIAVEIQQQKFHDYEHREHQHQHGIRLRR